MDDFYIFKHFQNFLKYNSFNASKTDFFKDCCKEKQENIFFESKCTY